MAQITCISCTPSDKNEVTRNLSLKRGKIQLAIRKAMGKIMIKIINSQLKAEL